MDFLGIFNQGWFGIVAGLAIAVFLYTRAKRDPQISYQVSTQTLIAKVPKSLKGRVSINIDGQQTDDLLSTRLVFWNSGDAAVKSDSFPTGGGLLIFPEKMSEVLGFDILTTTNTINGVQLKQATSGISISLDYLNPGDGAIIDILHKFGAGKIRLSGILLGQRQGIFYEGSNSVENSTQSFLSTSTKDLLTGLVVFIFGVFCLRVAIAHWSAYSEGIVLVRGGSIQAHFYYAIFLSIVSAVAVLAGILAVLISRRHPPRRITLQENSPHQIF